MRVFNVWRRFTVLGIILAITANTVWADINSSPMVVFSKSGDPKPYFSEWRGGTWTPGSGTDMPSVGATPNWVVVQNCPTRYETACATLDSSRKVNLLFHNGTSWTSPTQVCANTGTAAERAVSLAYENMSGDLLIAYWDTSLNKIGYRTYNGSTLSGQSTVDLPSSTHTKYVALYPKPGGDEIIMLAIQNDWRLSATVWNGSGWRASTSLCTNLIARDRECASLAYEGVSGRALAIYTPTNQSSPEYQIWNGSGWSDGALMPIANTLPRWFRLATDPDSNAILFGSLYGSGGSGAIHVSVWNGSSWGNTLQVESAVQNNDIRRFDVAYEKGTGKGLVVYQKGTQTSLRYRTWNGSSWSAEQTGTNIGDAARFIQLRTSLTAGEVFIAASDAGNDLELARWNGSSMSATPQQLCGTVGGVPTTEQFMMAMPAERKPISVIYWREVPRTPASGN